MLWGAVKAGCAGRAREGMESQCFLETAGRSQEGQRNCSEVPFALRSVGTGLRGMLLPCFKPKSQHSLSAVWALTLLQTDRVDLDQILIFYLQTHAWGHWGMDSAQGNAIIQIHFFTLLQANRRMQEKLLQTFSASSHNKPGWSQCHGSWLGILDKLSLPSGLQTSLEVLTPLTMDMQSSSDCSRDQIPKLVRLSSFATPSLCF